MDNGIHAVGIFNGVESQPWRNDPQRYEILDRVSDYLAGAYDCLSLLSVEQSRIATQQKAESISFNHLEEYCRQSYGRFIEVMLSVYDGCPEIVVEKLRRDDALPARLIPSSIPIRE